MKRNYSKGGSSYKKKTLSSVEKERIERMLVHLEKGELYPIKQYFLALIKNNTSSRGLKGTANKFSKELELKQTDAEIKMGKILNELKIANKVQRIVYYGDGKKFFILDFFLLADKIAIEVDGGYHESEAQIKKDVDRDRILKDKGINVIRFKNEEVDDLDLVKDRLSKFIKIYYVT